MILPGVPPRTELPCSHTRRQMPSVGPIHWFVDAMNVIGSRPDGWWRERDAAAGRLIDAVRAWAQAEGARVTVVLDAGPAELAGERDGVRVVLAPRRGRDAADDEIARLAAGCDGALVVTSDAALAARARAAAPAPPPAARARARGGRAGGGPRPLRARAGVLAPPATPPTRPGGPAPPLPPPARRTRATSTRTPAVRRQRRPVQPPDDAR